MTNIINSYQNQYNVSNSGINRESVQNKLSGAKDVAADNFESNSAVKAVSGNDPDHYKKVILALPFLSVIDGAADNIIGGKKGNGILQKFAKAGDKISDTFGLGKTGGKISDFIKNNRFTKYFTSDFRAVPKSTFALSEVTENTSRYTDELIGALGELMHKDGFEKYLEGGSEALSSKTLEFLKKIDPTAGGNTKVTEGLSEAVDEIVSKGISKVSKKGILPKTTNISAINNKLKATESQIGKTQLGKGMAKGAVKAKDIISMNGGLLGLAFVASAFIKAAGAAKEAPEGEKKSTFMHVLSENYLGLALFGPSIKLLYNAGGNKYRGMDVKGREALKELVKNTNATETLTKEGYKVAQMQKKLLLKGVNKDEVAKLAGKSLEEAKGLFKSLKRSGTKVKGWEKPLKAAGTILDSGLDTIKNPSMTGKIKNKLKGFGGGFMRFALIMFVIQPLIQKPLTKLVHKIFGEPKSYLEKEKAKSGNDSVRGEIPEVAASYNAKPWTSLPSDIIGQTPAGATTIQPYGIQNQYMQPGMMQQPYAQQPYTQATMQQPYSTPGYQPQPLPAATMNTPYIPSVPQQNRQPNDEAIGALNLSSKNKGGETTYIPSINVDFSNIAKKDTKINKEVEAMLKNTDSLIAQTKRLI